MRDERRSWWGRPAIAFVAAVLVAGGGASCDRDWSPADTADDVPPADGDGASDADADADADATDGEGDVAEGDADTGEDAAEDVSCAPVSYVYDSTPAALPVPPDVHYLHVKAWAAGGNAECGGEGGSCGGYSEAVFELTEPALGPGTSLTVLVGEYGAGSGTPRGAAEYGFNSGGGGGLSGVFLGADVPAETDASRALIVAGGGGGGGFAVPCIAGGNGNAAGSGGEPTMLGGTGADEVNGGGGGYSGGSGGSIGGSGVGGSGHVDTDRVSSATDYRIEAATTGSEPPRTTDPDYDPATPAGGPEEGGRVVIHFTCVRPALD